MNHIFLILPFNIKYHFVLYVLNTLNKTYNITTKDYIFVHLHTYNQYYYY